VEAYSKPLDRLREAVRWFVAVPELLLLHVWSGADLRVAALQEIAQAQLQPENRNAICVCTTPAVDGDADWTARSEELGETVALVAEEAAKAEPPVAIRVPRHAAEPGYVGFTRALKQAVETLSPAFGGVTLVLAPEGIEIAEQWLADLRRLFQDRSLAKVRFIVVETEPAPARALAAELGGLGEAVDIRVDPAAMRRYLRALVEGMKNAPAGADPQRIAGMAGPREAPPPRRGRAVAPAPEVAAPELQAAGVPAAAAQPEVMKELRVEALSASLAQQEGRQEEAIQHQLRARNVAESAGLAREATLMQLMLGGYLLQSGGTAQALDVFDDAARRAKTGGFVELETQSQMAKGGALLMLGRPLDAVRAYGTGGQLAEQGGARTLAIECYRMVGQIFLSQGNETQAATAWQRALAVADGTPQEERLASSAPIAARDLAAMYRRHGLATQANALEEQVKRWETELPAPPDTAPETSAAPANGATAANGSPSVTNGTNGGSPQGGPAA
jgi:tetratricopeptide (TPR) repeat protein